MTDRVISIVPQLLCRKLARDLGHFLDGEPSATPSQMLEACEEILGEIGAEKDANGVWRMPGEDDSE